MKEGPMDEIGTFSIICTKFPVVRGIFLFLFLLFFSNIQIGFFK